MDGLFEILIILAFFLLPVLEGILKKRRRDAGDAPPGEAPVPSGDLEVPEREGEPASSEDLVPEEFWEEVMGGAGGDAPEEAGVGTPDQAEPRDEPAPWERGGAGGAEVAAEGAGEDRPTGTWISEPPAGPVGSPPDAGLSGPPATEEEARSEALRRELAAGASGAGGRRGGRPSELRRVRSGRMARRGLSSATGAHPLLGEIERESMRRAVVWREVLGPPVALRDEDA